MVVTYYYVLERDVNMDISFKDFRKDTDTQIQAIFSSAFIFQNKLPTACDKLQKDITMKQ